MSNKGRRNRLRGEVSHPRVPTAAWPGLQQVVALGPGSRLQTLTQNSSPATKHGPSEELIPFGWVSHLIPVSTN